MIHVIVPFALQEAAKARIKSLGLAGDHAVRVLCYPDLAQDVSCPPGSYVFASASVLTPSQRSLAGVAEEALIAGGPGFRVLNRPLLVAPRRATMEMFRADGLDVAETWTVGQMPARVKYPLVLRWESPQGIAESPVLGDEPELREALGTMVLGGYALENIYGLHLAEHEGILGRAPAVWLLKLAGRVVASDSAGSGHGLGDSEGLWMRALDRAGLDFVKLSFLPVDDRLILWQIDDSPLAVPDCSANPAGSSRVRDEISAAFQALSSSSREGGTVAIRFTPEMVLTALQACDAP
jgi:hypothetical protein